MVLAGKEIDAGTVSAAVFEASEIGTLVDCACASVAVQFVAIFGERLDTAHTTVEIAGAGVRVMDVWAEVPLYVAVIVVAWLDLMSPAVIVNDAVVAPAATVTEAGTVSALTVDFNAITAPPVGADWLSVIEQVVLALIGRLEARH